MDPLITWLLAGLAVAVLAGVAVVAAGHGAPLAEAEDDRPDVLVPAEGPLRAEDLRRVRFPLAVRGYRMAEVDALLDRLAAQLEAEPGAGEGRDAPGGAESADRGHRHDG